MGKYRACDFPRPWSGAVVSVEGLKSLSGFKLQAGSPFYYTTLFG